MNRAALVLFLLATPAFADAASSTADAEDVVRTFVDVCMRTPHGWGAARAATRLGAEPMAEPAREAASPGERAASWFALEIDGVPVRIVVNDSVCELAVDAVDVRTTLKHFDAAAVDNYQAYRR